MAPIKPFGFIIRGETGDHHDSICVCRHRECLFAKPRVLFAAGFEACGKADQCVILSQRFDFVQRLFQFGWQNL